MSTRREFLTLATGAALVTFSAQFAFADEEDVTANEDLMREHGILRRAMLVYTLSSKKMRTEPGSVSLDALHRTAKLFRTFGEDYHERAVEEPFVFPAVKKTEGPAARYVDILLQQHQRGREITEYILTTTKGSNLKSVAGAQLPAVMEGFVLMYREHVAREDTEVFPAFKKSMSTHEYNEMGEKFDEIEKKQFGKDGFDDALKQMIQIETALGFDQLEQYTAPRPPRAGA